MSKGKHAGESVFDIERIREIVRLMEQHELVEVDLQQGDDRIKLNRGGVAPVYAAAPAAAQPAFAPAAAPAAAPAVPDNTITINAPMIGTFYSRANPDAEPFVQVGQTVTPDTIVCIVEAMKVFNEIPAECSGKVVEVLIQDQQAVDFGKPMFRIAPNA
ncbi:acetyl-CoA carboxylase biotin carboxyl carrier protein [Stieleria varia]|uniref:Biotin carboxyl carrier protein of acetyl-CoA carboxylase n=1 Tax=Stieleria varia TaxID=2528005 RepID=A0A5C6AR80_9BACT|nr:acetyl-CoA carboxylase biotin carboxyl carrier protein [Stieleria varia]TWU02465.1 Acetyl-CoA biotin carboxyl carrier [Stieleria varia]